MKALSAMIVVALAGASPVLAQSVLNPSYEKGPNASTGWTRVLIGSSAIEGWTVDRGNIDHVGSQWLAADGTRSLDMNGNRAGRIYQILDTTPGVEYTVNFALSGNWGGVANKTLRATAGNFTQLYTVNTSQNNGQNMHWTDQVFTFVATKEFTTIRFASQNHGNYGAAIDNITISAVPAPASAMALLGLAGLRRRRR